MTHLVRMGVGRVSQKNGVLHLVAGEATGEAGDSSFLARKEGFLLRLHPAQSVLTGFLQDSWVSRKILARDRMMGTAIGRKSGM